MKKVIIFFIIIVLFLSSCSCLPVELNHKEVSEKLVEAFDNRDADAVKALFAKKLSAEPDWDGQLKKAFKLYNTKSTSTEFRESTGGASKDDGEEAEWESCLVTVKTSDAEYTFSLTIVTYATDPDLMGIRELLIMKDFDSNTGKAKETAFVGASDTREWEAEDKSAGFFGDAFDPNTEYDLFIGDYNTKNKTIDCEIDVENGRMSFYRRTVSLDDRKPKYLIISGKINDYNGNGFTLVIDKVNRKLAGKRKVGDAIYFNTLDPARY